MFIAFMDAICLMVSKGIRTCVATAGRGNAIAVCAARHSASRHAQYCEGSRFQWTREQHRVASYRCMRCAPLLPDRASCQVSLLTGRQLQRCPPPDLQGLGWALRKRYHEHRL